MALNLDYRRIMGHNLSSKKWDQVWIVVLHLFVYSSFDFYSSAPLEIRTQESIKPLLCATHKNTQSFGNFKKFRSSTSIYVCSIAFDKIFLCCCLSNTFAWWIHVGIYCWMEYEWEMGCGECAKMPKLLVSEKLFDKMQNQFRLLFVGWLLVSAAL